jgi:hypothetical protein
VKTTTKQERKAAKKDAIGWHRIQRRDRAGALLFHEPDPKAGVAAWARHRRLDPVPIRVTVRMKVTYNPN